MRRAGKTREEILRSADHISNQKFEVRTRKEINFPFILRWPLRLRVFRAVDKPSGHVCDAATDDGLEQTAEFTCIITRRQQ